MNLELHGTTLDKIYNGFIEQISGGRVKTEGVGLQNAVDRDIERTKLEKQISDLEQKLRTTVQLNKKFEIKDQIRKIEAKVKELS